MEDLAPTELTPDAVRAEAADILETDISEYSDDQIRAAIDRAPGPGGWSRDPWEDWDGRKRLALQDLTGRDL